MLRREDRPAPRLAKKCESDLLRHLGKVLGSFAGVPVAPNDEDNNQGYEASEEQERDWVEVAHGLSRTCNKMLPAWSVANQCAALSFGPVVIIYNSQFRCGTAAHS